MRVRYLPRAFADLEAIHSYIAKHSPEAAVQVAGAITKSISGLAEFPEIGQAVDEETCAYYGAPITPTIFSIR
jgi:plasmid stabilization system protein ParE